MSPSSLHVWCPPHRRVSPAKLSLERLWWWAVWVSAAVAAVLVVLIATFLVSESLPLMMRQGLRGFFAAPGWWPLEGKFNLLPMLAASVALTAGALIVALPLGIATSLYTEFHAAPWLGLSVRRLVEASAAVPTVIYGLWGATVLVPWLQAVEPPGANLLAGMLVLALMVFPTVTMLSLAALREVPQAYVQASAALGVGLPQTLLHVVLPAARHGLFAAGVLAAARAVGETMVVLMVCGNIVQLPTSLFDPVRALTANIALELPYAMGDHRSALFVSGLVVMALVSVLVGLSEWSKPRSLGSAA